MKKVAIILSGCGSLDGSEIREALFAMLSLAQNGVKYQCFAPDIEQAYVVNHYTNEKMPGEKRNVLVESARLARGRVKNIKELNPAEFDGLLFPGGYGAVTNLANFIVKQSTDFEVDAQVESAIQNFFESKKPICFLCVSPMIAAKLLNGVKITLGNSTEPAASAIKLGAEVIKTDKNLPVIDATNKIISAPCYMLDITISELYEGILKTVQEFIKL